ncbi:hypothetical protein ACW5R3_07090 [Bizionia sp. KMM 8389]
MKDTLYQILFQFLQNKKIKINSEELKLQLLGHPSYPSLHAVTGVLSHFNINNVAIQVPVTAEILTQLSDIFFIDDLYKDVVDNMTSNKL